MEAPLASKIIDELGKSTRKKFAIFSSTGELLAKSANLEKARPSLNFDYKAFPIGLDPETTGFLYIDATRQFLDREGSALRAIANLVIHQDNYRGTLLHECLLLDKLLFEFFRPGFSTREGAKDKIILLCDHVFQNKIVILLETCNPDYLFFNRKRARENDRQEKISRIKGQISQTVNSFYRDHQKNIVSYLGNNTFLILKDMGSDPPGYEKVFIKTLHAFHLSLASELRCNITMGIGKYKKTDHDLKNSFAEAQTALRFGKQLWGEGRVLHYDNFGVIASLFSGVNRDNVSYSEEIIRKLQKAPHLLKTLKTYFDLDISVSKTSKRLGLHRNTLIYRLDKISEITGFDPRVFNDAFQLKIALILNSYDQL